ncbi:type II toxin-antitoxin system Phd/YefM family antitoxin [Janibacter terrae]|uniref:Antitoxin n=1 Tax=Janibacter terrae TaxID=103817 RepID=A0ABZ2FJ63_9MICO|nr:type II toxin-antitoxin system Phd/YefM family antitoxin [Janibacter terrae]HBO54913.1 type II toxin-antitoxin system Phd/YefM family antitoxin [Janibacter terrae]HCE61270.1 type II toxin-antitoxin system Phd/YefM family antitoxin [Janibacter terrae]
MSMVPLAEARAHLSRMVDEAVRTHQRVEITRNGRREAVLLSAEDYDILIETLDVLSDAELVRDIGTSLDEARQGEVLSTAEVVEAMRAAGRGRPQTSR